MSRLAASYAWAGTGEVFSRFDKGLRELAHSRVNPPNNEGFDIAKYCPIKL